MSNRSSDAHGNPRWSTVGFVAPAIALVWLMASIPAHAAVPQQERTALQDLYNNVNGANWRSSDNWTGNPGTECTWFGVTCDSGKTTVIGLNLSGNLLSGSIPTSMGNLTNLQVLDLSFNSLTGTVPTLLSTLTNLQQLNLAHNQLTGQLPSFFGSRANLQGLDLSGNQLTGSIPVTLGTFTKLQRIALSGNKLSGTIPPELGGLTNLQGLYLSSNQIGGSIPSELGNLTNLAELNLSSNVLSGSIPSSLGSLTNLQRLYLYSNLLSGSIPPELGNMAGLQQLFLNGNQLSGSIPSSLGSLTHLMNLNLSSNQLSGSIPSSLGNLPNILVLVLSSNLLSGPIPASLGNAATLVMLDLSSNQLSGAVPTSLTRLTNLGSIGISYNALYTNDPGLQNFLDLMQPAWEYTETVAPINVNAQLQSDSSILVSWLPISYTADSGRYQVWSSTTSGGPYALSGRTFTKSSSSLSLPGLASGTYYFVVGTTTDPNAHNRNGISSNLSAEISITTTPKSVSILPLGAGGATDTGTLGNSAKTQAGYAKITVNSGTAPYGTAVFSYRQNGVVVSEAGVPASGATTNALIFVDYRAGAAIPGSTGTVDVSTGFAAVNVGSGTATITASLRSLDGTQVFAAGTGTLSQGNHVAKYVNQLGDILSGFSIPASFPVSTRFGILELTSTQPLSIVALRLTTNQRGDTLVTTTPVAVRTVALTTTPAYIPQLVDGGGYTTTVMLMNTSGVVETGTIELHANDGSPLPVRQLGGPSASSFPYSIAPGGAYVFQTDASPAAANAGWVRLTPDNSPTPLGGGVFQYSRGGMLVTESGIPFAVPTTHARIYVDMSNSHDTGLALANPGNALANVILTAFLPDGTTPIGTSEGPIQLAGSGHFASFVDQQITGLPPDFRGVVDIASDSPVAALTLRSLVNGRGDFLLTTFPVADLNQSAPSQVFIPQFADGGGFTTEFILLSAGQASSAVVAYFGDSGLSITLTLSQ